MELHRCDGNLVTIQEVGAQTIFATEAALAGVGGAALPAGAPGWAVAMNANMTAGFAAVNAKLQNINARQMNAVASEDGDPIHPVLDNAGDPPPVATFPNTFGALLALPNANLGAADTLLQFYGMTRNPRSTRNLRLRKFLGVR
jgi:hypothetical protein